MKRIFAIIVPLSLAFLMCACASPKDTIPSIDSQIEITSENANSVSSVTSTPLREKYVSPLYFYSKLKKCTEYDLTLSDARQVLIKDNLPLLTAPEGYIFGEEYISDGTTIYIKALSSQNPENFRWLWACYTHEKCELNNILDTEMSKFDNEQFTYADDYSIFTDNDHCLKTAKCKFKDNNILTYVNVGAIRPEYFFDKENTSSFSNKRYILFSYIQNGKQILGERATKQSALIRNAPSYETLTKVGLENAFTYNSHKFDNDASENGAIAYNGDWDLFPSKMLYKQYRIDEQPTRQDWTTAVKNELIAIDMQDLSPIIINSWEFTWEGKKCSIINAGNVLRSFNGYTINRTDGKTTLTDGDKPPVVLDDICLPVDKNTGIYKMSIIFVEGAAPKVIANMALLSDFDSEVRANDATLHYMYRFNKNAQLEICKTNIVYKPNNNWDIIDNFLVCDTDGDGVAEVLYINESDHYVYPGFFKYELINGNAIKTFTMPL